MIDKIAAIAAVSIALIGLTVVKLYARQLQKVKHLLHLKGYGIKYPNRVLSAIH